MPFNIIVGAQWGDEGKGRVTDLMAAEADIVARYSGGDNAGHTVTIGEEIFRLHLVPSGIVHERPLCLIGNGTVVNPAVLLREIDGLVERGIDASPRRLKISRQAHLITPAHIALDAAHEKRRGSEAIGTTMRGIGPAYTDKTSRTGLRAGLFAEPERLGDAIEAHVAEKNQMLERLFEHPPLDPTAVAAEYTEYAQRLAPYLVESSVLLHEALAEQRVILAEGAQGTLLDLDHGTYPFVTSSHPTAAGALVGLGIGPKAVDRVVGVAKAFTTRVGSGPFPCELEGDLAQRLRGTGENPWDEFGTTTGRPRRVGWLDAVILCHAVRVNSATELALTKLDILSGFEALNVCVAYELDGERIDYFPSEQEALARARPVYETIPGWDEDVTGVRRLEDLPANARRYVAFVADSAGVPVRMISVGPARQQIIRP
ncbi:MAG TPA: adenylosuccinate synthase [Candidatus Sulfomarinibacteraceae bacterium]|nr:adenylosuccinate synthase [Candidatus Sulfomarinibacteraceae bacterium]